MTHRIRILILIALLTGISVSAYLLASQLTYHVGFPLDDAWIHQTYARNLGIRGEWAFVLGQPSAGSTAPLWSALLAVGYTLRIAPYLWTYFLGWVLLLGLSLLGCYAAGVLAPVSKGWRLATAVVLALEWHLVWAAVSGMETLLFAFVVTLVLVWLQSGWKHWTVLGILIGITAWIRPDGITLIGPAVVVLLLVNSIRWDKRLKDLGMLVFGVLIPFGLYLLFNHAISGSWWPNTYYAKQAEYAILRQSPLWRRYLDEAVLPFIGVGSLVIIGLIPLIVRSLKQKIWPLLAGVLWVIGYIFLYAWRLPVVYQHGRYIMPVIPILLIWGMAGMSTWMLGNQPGFIYRVLVKTWMISTGLVLVSFCFIGARLYARDVAFIETEMVATARWVAQNTRPGTVIAAHDVGALGFYGNFDERHLLDLAGLVTPDVIPFIRDEARLAIYLDTNKADYLISFPDWYPLLVKRATPIYQSGGTFAPSMNGENMVVYRWLPH
jgi:hypothetical protein